MPPYLWGSGIWEVQLDRRLVRCLGFYKGFDGQKNLQTPALHLFPQYLQSVHYVYWLSCFGFCLKIIGFSDRNSEPKVFTGGWKFVTLMVTDPRQKSKDLPSVSICGSYAFSRSSFTDRKKPNFVCTKPSVSVIINLRCGDSVCACALGTSCLVETLKFKTMQCRAGTDSINTAWDKLHVPLAHLLNLFLDIFGCSLSITFTQLYDGPP